MPHTTHLPQLLPDLTPPQLLKLAPRSFVPDTRQYRAVTPLELAVDVGRFSTGAVVGGIAGPEVDVRQTEAGLSLACTCTTGAADELCENQALTLLALLHRPELRAFFDAELRVRKLRATAQEYGLEQAPDVEAHFQLTFANGATAVSPRRTDLLPVTPASKLELMRQLLPAKPEPVVPGAGGQRLLVLARHRYYSHLTLHLVEASLTAAGKPKNPLTLLNPLDVIWQLTNPAELKFYTGLARFQHNYEENRTPVAVEALRAVVQNPFRLPVFAHRGPQGDKLTAAALVPVRLHSARLQLRLQVTQEAEFYHITGHLLLHDQALNLELLTVHYDYFVALHDDLYLLDDLDVWRVVEFFRKRNNALLIHQSQFAEFREDVLTNLENRLQIHYAYLRPATRQQLQAEGFDEAPEPVLYLSDAGPHVELLPVMRYGEREVAVLSKRQLQATDALGRAFTVARNALAEDRLVAALLRHWPELAGQQAQESFYLARSGFLDADRVLPALADWREEGIRVLGFRQLKSNRLNPHPARVSVQVSSETNWFDTKLAVGFGRQHATLPQLSQALRNRRRYVVLDDGSHGVLPQQWLEKFARYFAAAELIDGQLRTLHSRFAAVEELYAADELLPSARQRLAETRAAVADFTGIAPVPVPAGLHATLRDYQQEGLNWLNFLDTFGFGGCLADDMGLGKTLQVLAFTVRLREAGRTGPCLVVVPTSLVFNWQAEAARFAPNLRVLVWHGGGRQRTPVDFADYDLVLTTYGTLVSDLRRLKSQEFEYVFLDEAQAIKNPASLRYRAACQLRSRGRVALTGTPLENNTYDIFALLSFACPGLLGTLRQFRAQYATRIDKFGDEHKARELQQKIRPFVLRRTKAQVATELPEKTEMVLYCEMPPEQRRVYEACRQDFRNLLLGRREDMTARHHASVLRGLTRLRQICDSPALLPDLEDYGSTSAKLAVLLEEIQNHAPEHKILVFSQFVGMLNLVRPMLEVHDIPYQYLTGQTRQRGAAVQAFEQRPEVRVFLISLKAGGTGLNLTAADYVYLLDPWWNPAVENQAIDRAYRIGQTKPVVAVRLICPGTVEEKIQHLQQSKRELAQGLIHTDTALLKSLTPQELLALVGEGE
ncbi:DEAD/DEAH box helicase [Hymenobacter rigui]|uniref:ATP-dependent helicase n=1 Tax=Hymenobacter rigui TaxID=334424 RepID=A0A3R9NLI3_9BACT|nr:DEAD/DEAH box helicase [Hymenobacter rigui]RSK49833.1 ATP-dependent helicase [Hymenobacter rigui]